MVATMNVQAQQNYSTFIWPSYEDPSINVAVDKPTYFAGDSVYLSIQFTDSAATGKVIPMLSVEGMIFKSTGVNSYVARIPQQVIPESYKVYIKQLDTMGHHFFF
jgi:hypothetical protein